MDKYLLGDRYATWDAGQEAYYPALELSPYPDDPAGTTYIQDAWATVDGWTLTRCTADFTTTPGKMRITATDINPAVSRTISVANKTLRYRVKKISSASTYSRIAQTIAPAFGNNKTYDTDEIIHDTYTDATITGTNLVFYPGGNTGVSVAGDIFEIDFIYIGTGKYLDGSLQNQISDSYDGTIYGGVPDVAGKITRDGINDYERTVSAVTMPDIFHYHETWTIPNHATQVQIILGIGTSGSGRLLFYRTVNARSLEIYYWNGTANGIVVLSNFFDAITTELEADVEINWLTGAYVVSKNGIQFAAGIFTTPVKPSALVWYFGIQPTLSSTQFCGGSVANRRWFNRALTAQQVADLSSNTVYTYGRLYNEEMLNSHEFFATWSNAYQFDYLSGTTVFITPTLTASIPEGALVEICAGESLASCTTLESGTKGQVLFTSPTSGLTNLYVKLNFFSSQNGLTPIVSALELLVEQSTSLYTIATQILSDALTQSNGKWDIDTELQKYPIPYAWFNTIKHREAIGKVAEAAGGVAFQDRYGLVRVQAGNYLSRLNGTANFNIGENRILDAESPVSEVKNRIIIKTRPYVEDASATVWELTGDKVIGLGESKTYKATFSDYDAVIDCASSISSVPTGATITSETFYSFGADITVLGSAADQVLTLSVSGKPLIIKGAQIIEETDGDSIRRNGDRALTIEDNSMIQSAQVAETIAEDILSTTAEEKRDIVISWRGDPTLELGDKGMVTGYDVAIVEQEFNFNGALSVTSRMRKV